MIAVLPSYQKSETGKLPSVASNEGYGLNIEISAHQIAACVEVLAFKQFLFLQEFNFSKPINNNQLIEVCGALFASEPVFTLQCKQVNIAINTSTQLVPNGFKQHCGSANTIKINEEMFAAFEPDEKLQEVLLSKFLEINTTTIAANFLKQVLVLPKGVYVLVLNEQFFIAVLEAPGKLLLFNSFDYKTAEDFLYFLMFACEALAVNRSETPLVFCGKIQQASKIYDVCYRYFSQIVFLKPGNGKFFSKAFSEAQKSIHFSLFSL